MGEVYDAREAPSPAWRGWDSSGFDDSRWSPVDVGAELKPIVQSHPAPPVRAFAELKPRTIKSPNRASTFSTLARTSPATSGSRSPASRAGRSRLRFAERLNPDGTIYTTNLREARVTDTYLCSGQGEETWTPRFTFHGFQYVELTGLKSPPNERRSLASRFPRTRRSSAGSPVPTRC